MDAMRFPHAHGDLDNVNRVKKQTAANNGLDVIADWDRRGSIGSDVPESSTSETHSLDYPEITREDGLVKGILGRTWPGIEYGEPPRPSFSFFQYVDALRRGNLELYKTIQEADRDWWFPTLDRGDGAVLHFAVDHGQLECVKFLVEECNAEVNQQDSELGWTPLHRCARMAHVTQRPYLAIFEYLLSNGADPNIKTYDGRDIRDRDDTTEMRTGAPLSVYDVCVEKGRGWRSGNVRSKLQACAKKYQKVPKRPAYVYAGVQKFGIKAASVLSVWQTLRPNYPPDLWMPTPEPGFEGSQGMRLLVKEPWRPAGDNDGSCFLRPMTDEELASDDRKALDIEMDP